MTDGWTKHFVDGTKYIGLDSDPHKTWRNSRNTGMIRAECEWRAAHISITGLGEFWQSDDMESIMSLDVLKPSKIVARRIQKLMTHDDFTIEIRDTETTCHVRILPRNIPPPYIHAAAKPGEWFVVELVSTKDGGMAILYYTSKERI